MQNVLKHFNIYLHFYFIHKQYSTCEIRAQNRLTRVRGGGHKNLSNDNRVQQLPGPRLEGSTACGLRIISMCTGIKSFTPNLIYSKVIKSHNKSFV